MNHFSKMIKGVLIAMGMTGAAYADHQWTGYYAGVDMGVAFNDAQLTSQHLGFANLSGTCNTSSNYSTLTPGAQLGYLYQFPNAVVAGVEANVTMNADQVEELSCNSNINPAVYDQFAFRDQMQAAVKGRIGRAWNWHEEKLLPYAVIGASFANVGLTYKNEGGDYYSNNTTQAGWLVGAGIEWLFRSHWSVRAEYDYIDYGNAINLNIPNVYGLIDPNGKGHVNLNSNNVVVALNYWV